ncbi:MAG: low temperature requirement protein A [Coriobacteriales bacterium]|nr:low temperature requirement protein A [Coriobacteriales bacterium]
MVKRLFVPAEGVSNIELFYDLIFVHCISVLTSLVRHVPESGFPSMDTWIMYFFSFCVVLQVWFFTTLLMNRYGERSIVDAACMFANMFLLYFLSNGIRADWKGTQHVFLIAWALILANLILHWVIKLFRYTNLDDDDRKIMRWNIATLAVQLAIVVVTAFLPTLPSVIAAWGALLFGIVAWRQPKVYAAKPSRFSHICERCSLLTIIAFGEAVVAIAPYTTQTSSIVYPVFVFVLVVGLFLIYIFEQDNMIDHHARIDGMAYMTITSWMVVVIGTLTVALEFMVMRNVEFMPKNILLVGCLFAYLLTSFLLGRYNKPEFRYSALYVAGRLGTCAFIVAVAVVTNFDPLITLICDTGAVYFALCHEWILYRRRSGKLSFGHSLDYTDEDE